MKSLLIFIVLVGLGVGAYYKFAGGASQPQGPSVHIGASMEEVEKVFGPPLNVLPQMGNQMRIYKAKSGKKYTLIFDSDAKVVEIHD